MKYLIFLLAILITGCGMMSGGGSPSDTLKTFIAGMKEKDAAKVKGTLSKNSQKMLESAAKSSNQSIEDFISSGKASEGFNASGETRNEKIDDETATVEAKSGDKWETLHLVKEDGMWKIALDKG